ncbi:MAG: metal ABC transporter ATP-binding protein [Planctomycetota bacterium]
MLQTTTSDNRQDHGAQGAAVVRAEGLTVAYDARPVLRSVSFEVLPGEMIGIIGPNGAGKSTLLKCLLGLIHTDYGRVELFGRPAEDHRSAVAYVPQTEGVDWDFPVTVRDVVLMGRARRGWLGWPNVRDRVAARDALEQVGMTRFAKRHIRQLSGGQQRRVFLARALCQQAELLLLDEPFAGVDAASEQAIYQLIEEIRQSGKTVIVVNHDLSILSRFDRVLMLNQRVIAYGPPSEVVNDHTLSATYGGRLSLLDMADETLRSRTEPGDEHLNR